MDMKRYEEITSEEAIKRIINKEEVFDKNEKRFFSLGKSNTVWVQTEHSHGSETSSSGHTLEDLLDKKWFIKKPFDVRAEMLARPNEWVGSFKLGDKWQMIGFSPEQMSVFGRRYQKNLIEFSTFNTFIPINDELDRCIPIEDVPEEELT
ncbi:hypothetical protein RSA11_04525 [Exiguobacterium indicum]|uniref:Uncharacterized protein n=1 Tax=Exiguobacterium indicum TaxID=296995 RepID=A0AAW3MFM2_9BACL|nr:hypothetical protein [Exiguobacterium indicum]KTR27928.1 hypothetical protein RSA11_04525 [Exiguobacterium indicum]